MDLPNLTELWQLAQDFVQALGGILIATTVAVRILQRFVPALETIAHATTFTDADDRAAARLKAWLASAVLWLEAITPRVALGGKRVTNGGKSGARLN